MRKREIKDWLTRYEAKYIIPESLCDSIRDFIKPFCNSDSHAAGTPPQYMITTLQFDTPDYALHYAKEQEAVNRFKLRARTYGAIGSSPVFSEVKAKLEHTIIKNRAQIRFDQWGAEAIMGMELPECLHNDRQIHDFLQFKRLVWETHARPVALIRYLRESYVGAIDHYARVTMDRELEYQMTDSWDDFGRSGLWRNMDSTEAQGGGLPYSGVILELKTLAHVPTWIQELVERFELKNNGNCKYSTAIWREGGFRGYPQAGSFTEELLAMI
jgi:hypothetical protein